MVRTLRLFHAMLLYHLLFHWNWWYWYITTTLLLLFLKIYHNWHVLLCNKKYYFLRQNDPVTMSSYGEPYLFCCFGFCIARCIRSFPIFSVESITFHQSFSDLFTPPPLTLSSTIILWFRWFVIIAVAALSWWVPIRDSFKSGFLPYILSLKCHDPHLATLPDSSGLEWRGSTKWQ